MWIVVVDVMGVRWMLWSVVSEMVGVLRSLSVRESRFVTFQLRKAVDCQ